MKIIIEVETELPHKDIFDYFKDKCIDALQNFKLNIEGTEFEYIGVVSERW